jgi:hypothetical protein
MTQAFNLSQLANNLNTSGQLDATDGLTGAVPVANGGTGLTSTPTNGQLNIGNGTGFTRATITAGTGISVTNGAGSITIATAGGGGVTSLNGQTGAITNTDFNAIGSYAGGVPFTGIPNQVFSAGSTISGTTIQIRSDANTSGTSPFFSLSSGTANRTSYGKTGTWRAMSESRHGSQQKDSYNMSPNLWVRIS